MAVRLRLTRIGSKQKPFYRMVAIDSRIKRDGRYIEVIGTYNPLNGEINVKKEPTLKWLNQGAQPSNTVRNILSKEGILKEFHESKSKKK